MKPDEIFDSAVKNALDFLEHSINEIESDPKYSLIHFFSAVEIIFKARLMLEHWALVFENPKEANFTKFQEGDFTSVNVNEAIDRLKNVSKIQFSENEIKTYDKIRKHRNKLIHFYHPDILGEGRSEIIQKVVSEECRAWFFLYQLLTKKWKTEFLDYQELIEALNQEIKRNRQYLEVKYETIRPDIEKGITRGVVFSECSYCGFPAAREKQHYGILTEANCLICENAIEFIRVSCPNCEEDIIVLDMSEGECKCGKCGYPIDVNYLLDVFGVYRDPKDELIEPAHAYCSNCERGDIATVIPFGEKYLCLNCFAVFDSVSYCEWCNEKNAGLSDTSFMSGCVVCFGRGDWKND
jgi:ribosomal protein S27AE